MFNPSYCWASQDLTGIECPIGDKSCEGEWNCHHRSEKQCDKEVSTDVGLCLSCFLRMAVV